MTKLCANCSSQIESKRADAIYCSTKCRNALRQRRWSNANPERSRETWRRDASTQHGTATLLLNYAKDRASKGRYPFEIDREFVLKKLEAGICELSGIPLEREFGGTFKAHPFGPSLDKIVPSMGYTKQNTRMVCFAVNRARSDWGDEVLMKVAHALVKGITE